MPDISEIAELDAKYADTPEEAKPFRVDGYTPAPPRRIKPSKKAIIVNPQSALTEELLELDDDEMKAVRNLHKRQQLEAGEGGDSLSVTDNLALAHKGIVPGVLSRMAGTFLKTPPTPKLVAEGVFSHVFGKDIRLPDWMDIPFLALLNPALATTATGKGKKARREVGEFMRQAGEEYALDAEMAAQSAGDSPTSKFVRDTYSSSLVSLPVAGAAALGGLPAAAATAGLQSYAGAMDEAMDGLRKNNPNASVEELERLAAPNAMLRGLVTAALTGKMPGGMERLAQMAKMAAAGEMGRDTAKKIIFDSMKETLNEFPEGFVDSLAGGIAARLDYDPDRTPGQILKEAFDGGIQEAFGTVMVGGGTAALRGANIASRNIEAGRLKDARDRIAHPRTEDDVAAQETRRAQIQARHRLGSRKAVDERDEMVSGIMAGRPGGTPASVGLAGVVIQRTRPAPVPPPLPQSSAPQDEDDVSPTPPLSGTVPIGSGLDEVPGSSVPVGGVVVPAKQAMPKTDVRQQDRFSATIIDENGKPQAVEIVASESGLRIQDRQNGTRWNVNFTADFKPGDVAPLRAMLEATPHKIAYVTTPETGTVTTLVRAEEQNGRDVTKPEQMTPKASSPQTITGSNVQAGTEMPVQPQPASVGGRAAGEEDLFPDLKGKAPTLERVRRAVAEQEKVQTDLDGFIPGITPQEQEAQQDAAQKRMDRLLALQRKLETDEYSKRRRLGGKKPEPVKKNWWEKEMAEMTADDYEQAQVESGLVSVGDRVEVGGNLWVVTKSPEAKHGSNGVFRMEAADGSGETAAIGSVFVGRGLRTGDVKIAEKAATKKPEQDKPGKLSPMMEQYRKIKGGLPADSLLMFRLGDFYEFFFDDATDAAKIIGLTLTNRNGVPMAGIPHHAKDSYVEKLLRAGKRVAVVDDVDGEKKVTETLVPKHQPNQQAATTSAESALALIDRVLASMSPAFEKFGARIVESDGGQNDAYAGYIATSGGVLADTFSETPAIVYSKKRLAENAAGMPGGKMAEYIRSQFQHELVHLAQHDVLYQAWKRWYGGPNRATFAEFSALHYGDIWNEMTPEHRAAALSAYLGRTVSATDSDISVAMSAGARGGNLPPRSLPSGKTDTGQASAAYEAVRQIVQGERYGKTDEEFLADVGPKLIKFLREIAAALRGMIQRVANTPGADSRLLAAEFQRVLAALDRAEKTTGTSTTPKGSAQSAPPDEDAFVAGLKVRLLAGESFSRATMRREIPPVAEWSDKEYDEAIELAAVGAAREIVARGMGPLETYDALLDVESRMPNLTAKTSDSRVKQQFSTPISMAYLVQVLGDTENGTLVLEPTAGHGALLTTAKAAMANELSPDRLRRLRKTFPNATGLDASLPQYWDGVAKSEPDRVVSNPPFGSVMDETGTTGSYNVPGLGKPLRSIDRAIMWNALHSMAPDGKAVFIIAGQGPLGKRLGGESGTKNHYKSEFFSMLYNRYNVTAHFTVDGPLYGKQGAKYPVDVIVVEGKIQKPEADVQLAPPALTPPKLIKTHAELRQILADKVAGRKADNELSRPDGGDGGGKAVARPAKPRRSAGKAGDADGTRPVNDRKEREETPPGGGTGDNAPTGKTGSVPPAAGGTDAAGGDAGVVDVPASGGEPRPGGTGGVGTGGTGRGDGASGGKLIRPLTDKQKALAEKLKGLLAKNPPAAARAASQRDRVVAKYERDLDKALDAAKAGVVVDHNTDDPDFEFWSVYSKAKGNSRKAMIYRNERGQLEVRDENDSGIGWDKTIDEALRSARDHVEAGGTRDVADLDMEARSEIIGTIDVPPDMVLKDISDTKWGSIYYKVQKVLSRDEDGEPDETEDYKLSIRDHEPSPFREREFGASDYWVEVPKNVSPAQLSEAVGKVERWLQRRSDSETQMPTGSPPVGARRRTDPQVFSTGAELMDSFINDSELSDFAEIYEQFEAAVGADILPYVEGFYEQARRNPDLAGIVFTPPEQVAAFLKNRESEKPVQQPEPAPEPPPAPAPTPKPPTPQATSANTPSFGGQSSSATPKSAPVAQGTVQTEWEPISKMNSLGVLVPANLLDPMRAALLRLQEEVGGSLDAYVLGKLDYTSEAELRKALAAEQVEALALAIYNNENGNAFINADMTGVGKGRAAAALIRYAILSGKTPIFVTENPGLYSSMLTDLADITPDREKLAMGIHPDVPVAVVKDEILTPFFTNNNIAFTDDAGRAWKTDSNTRKIGSLPSILEQASQSGTLPLSNVSAPSTVPQKRPRYQSVRANAIFTSYKQIGHDVPKGFREDKRAKASRKIRNDKGHDPQARPDGERMRFLRSFSKNAFLILDEAHNAAGLFSDTNIRVGQLVDVESSMVYFSSATAIKEPSNMPIYARRLSINETGLSASDMVEVFTHGGIPLQQATTFMLAQEGQFVRRELDWRKVKFGRRIADSTEAIAKHRTLSDEYMGVISELARLSLRVQDWINGDSDNGVPGWTPPGFSPTSAGSSRSKTDQGSITGTNFASNLFQIQRQFMMALKADAVVEAVIEIRTGKKADGTPILDASGKPVGKRKPAIIVDNTMEGPLADISEAGLPPDFQGILKLFLKKLLTAKIRKPGENEESEYNIRPDELPPAMRQAYDDIVFEIENASFGDLPISPIDFVKEKCRRAGIKIGEITGRTTGMDYSSGFPKLYNRPASEVNLKAKLAVVRGYSNNEMDAILYNVAGATGLNMHAKAGIPSAGEQRVGVVWQAALDIAVFTQALGRLHRTGQLSEPEFMLLSTTLPGEMRSSAMLSARMASLNANTTSNDKSEQSRLNEMPDIFNKYGDEAVRHVITANPELGDLLNLHVVTTGNAEAGASDEASHSDDEAAQELGGVLVSRASGRAQILQVSDQEKFWNGVMSYYRAKISELNESGENDLVSTVKDYEAKLLSSDPLYQGTGDSVFSGVATLNRYDVKRQGKLAKVEEMKAMADSRRDGIVTEYYAWQENAEEFFAKRIAEMRLKGMPAENISTINAAKERLLDRAEEASKIIGSRVIVKDRLGNTSLGVITDVLFNQNKDEVPLFNSRAVIHMNGEKSRMTVSLTSAMDESRFHRITDEEMTDAEFDLKWKEAESLVQQKVIATGNIIGAIESAKALKVNGRVISFTDSDGAVQIGLEFPNAFGGGRLVPIKTAEGLLRMLARRVAYGEAPRMFERILFGTASSQNGVSVAIRRTSRGQAREQRDGLDRDEKGRIHSFDFETTPVEPGISQIFNPKYAGDYELQVTVPASKSAGGLFWRNPKFTALFDNSNMERTTRNGSLAYVGTMRLTKDSLERFFNLVTQAPFKSVFSYLDNSAGAAVEQPEFPAGKPAGAEAAAPETETKPEEQEAASQPLVVVSQDSKNSGILIAKFPGGKPPRHVLDGFKAAFSPRWDSDAVAWRLRVPPNLSPEQLSEAIKKVEDTVRNLFNPPSASRARTISEYERTENLLKGTGDDETLAHEQRSATAQNLGVEAALEAGLVAVGKNRTNMAAARKLGLRNAKAVLARLPSTPLFRQFSYQDILAADLPLAAKGMASLDLVGVLRWHETNFQKVRNKSVKLDGEIKSASFLAKRRTMDKAKLKAELGEKAVARFTDSVAAAIEKAQAVVNDVKAAQGAIDQARKELAFHQNLAGFPSAIRQRVEDMAATLSQDAEGMQLLHSAYRPEGVEILAAYERAKDAAVAAQPGLDQQPGWVPHRGAQWRMLNEAAAALLARERTLSNELLMLNFPDSLYQQLSSFESGIMDEWNKDPEGLVSGFAGSIASMSTQAGQMSQLWQMLNKEVVAKMRAATMFRAMSNLADAVENSQEWRQLYNTAKDWIAKSGGEAAADRMVPTLVRPAWMSEGERHREKMDANIVQEPDIFNAQEFVWTPDGRVTGISLNPDDAARQIPVLESLLDSINAWLTDPRNAPALDAAGSAIPNSQSVHYEFWKAMADKVENIYLSGITRFHLVPAKDRTLWSFGVLTGYHKSWGVGKFLLKANATPAGRLATYAAGNFKQAYEMAQDWIASREPVITRALAKAAIAHGYQRVLGSGHDVHQWYADVGRELFWMGDKIGRVPAVGTLLGSGKRLLREDVEALRVMHEETSSLVRKQASVGREGVMQDARVDDGGVFRRAVLTSDMMLPRTFNDEVSDKLRAGHFNWMQLRPGDNKITVRKWNEMDSDAHERTLEILESEEMFRPFLYSFLRDRHPDFARPQLWEKVYAEAAKLMAADAEALAKDPGAVTSGPKSFRELFDLIESRMPPLVTRQDIEAGVMDEIIRQIENVYDAIIRTDIGATPMDRQRNSFTAPREKRLACYYFYKLGTPDMASIVGFGNDYASYWFERYLWALEGRPEGRGGVVEELKTRLAQVKSEKESAVRRGDREATDRLTHESAEVTAKLADAMNTVQLLKNIYSSTGQVVRENFRSAARATGVLKSLALASIRSANNFYLSAAILHRAVAAMTKSHILAGRVVLPQLLKIATSAGGIPAKLGSKMLKNARLALGAVRSTPGGLRASAGAGLSALLDGMADSVFDSLEGYKFLSDMGYASKNPLGVRLENRLLLPGTGGTIYENDSNPALSAILSLVEFGTEPLKAALPRGFDLAANLLAANSAAGLLNIYAAQLRRVWDEAPAGRFNLANRHDPKNELLPSEVVPYVGGRRLPWKPGTNNELKEIVFLFAQAGLSFNDMAFDFFVRLDRATTGLTGDAKKAAMADVPFVENENVIGQIGLVLADEVNKGTVLTRSMTVQGNLVLRELTAMLGYHIYALRNVLSSFGPALKDPATSPRALAAMSAFAYLSLVYLYTGLVIGHADEQIIRWLQRAFYNEERNFPMPHEAGNTRQKAQQAVAMMLGAFPLIGTAASTLVSTQPFKSSSGASSFLQNRISQIGEYIVGVAKTGDPTHRLSQFAGTLFPLGKTVLNRLPSQEGRIEGLNIGRMIQRHAPEDLVRRSTGGGEGATPLTPYGERIVNAIMRGDSGEARQEFDAAVSVATAAAMKSNPAMSREKARSKAEDSVRSLVENRNPATRGLKAKPTQEQMRGILSSMSGEERARVENGLAVFEAGAAALGANGTSTKASRAKLASPSAPAFSAGADTKGTGERRSRLRLGRSRRRGGRTKLRGLRLGSRARKLRVPRLRLGRR